MARGRWRSPVVLVALAFLLHFLKLGVVFRDVRPASPYPIVNVDYVCYYARIVRFSKLLSRSGRLWGYDPFAMGGTLTGPVDGAGLHLFALLCWALSRVAPIARSLLALELLSFALAPLLFAGGVALFGGLEGSAAALLLATLMYGTLEPVSNGSLRHGNWAFQLAAWLSPLAVILLERWLKSRRAWDWAAATALTAALALLTPLSALIVGFPMLLLLAFRAAALEGRQWRLIALSAALVLAACWPWAGPLLRFPEWRAAAPSYLHSMDWPGLRNMFDPFGGWSLPVAVCLRVLLLGLALDWLRRRPRGEKLFFGAWLALLAGMAVTGSAWPIVDSLQPARFAIPFWLLVYAGAGLRFCERGFLKTAMGKASVLLLAAGLACDAASVVIPGAGFLWPRLTNRLPARQQAVLDALAAHEPLRGRLLIECLDDALPHFSELISTLQGQAEVGGPMPADQRPTRFTLLATSGAYGNRPIFADKFLDTLSEADFAAYLKLYDVSTVLARSPAVEKDLSRYRTLLQPLARVDGAMVYDVRQPATWLLSGKASAVSFDYDRLTLDGASRGLLVLKFHWLKTLKADPPMAVEPVRVLDDPVPFIGVRNETGAARITISD